MRSRWAGAVLPGAFLTVAAGVLAQAAPEATPTPAPAEKTRRLPVRIVLPYPESSPDLGQQLPPNPVEVVPADRPEKAKEAPGNELVVAPLPLSNPAIGSGLGVAAVYTLARKDAEKQSPPTTLGGGGFYTSNGSWAGMAGVKLYLAEDRFRVTVGAGLGSIRYDLFAEGPDERGIPITQEFEGALGEVMFGVGKRWYVGLRAAYVATRVGLARSENGEIPVPAKQLDATLATLGLQGELDSRDSVFYPTEGARLKLLVNHSDASYGSDYTYTKTTVTYGGYSRLAEPVVLAWQAAGCYAGSGAPFYDLCLFGTQNVLRGYTAGRYLDRWTLATQAEARWRFANRWVTTAFLGVGGIKPEFSRSDETELLGAGGVGIQWIAAPENMITVRADYAMGKDGSDGFYVGIGQAF